MSFTRYQIASALTVVMVYATSVTASDAGLLANDADQARPNIVLIMCDDLGWGDVGFNGNGTIQTPHLDRLAADGLVLDRFYAAAPVCSPTRGSCLTGRHPYRYGIYTANAGHLPSEELCLAELLKEAGYATGHFGKWHLGTLTVDVVESNRGGPRGRQHFSPPWRNGFDACFSTEAKVPTWDPMRKPRVGSINRWWHAASVDEPTVPYNTHYWDEQGRQVTDNLLGDDSRVIMDRVLPFVRAEADRDRPFLAVIWFHAPHLPVVAGRDYVSMYPGEPPYRQHYFGCISALDEQVGRLRMELERQQIADDTLIWFCSDNGPEGAAGKAPGSAGPFRGRKRDLFEGGIRVPACVVWPNRIKPGSRTNVPAVTSDYLPTVAELLDVELPIETLDGISLVPLIEGKMESRPTPIAFRSRNQSAWIENRFKLLVRNDVTMLFDLVKDPSETSDLSAEDKTTTQRMKQQLQGWIDSLPGRDVGVRSRRHSPK